jgi:hypothetical protein
VTNAHWLADVARKIDMGAFFPLSKAATYSAMHLSELVVLLFGVLLVAGLVGELAKSPKWKARERCFELMVIIGVSGELFGDGGIFVFSERLQTISDQEVAGLNIEAGVARQNAAEAERSAAEAQRKTAEIQKENLLLRAQIGPRRLSGDQKSKLKKLLESHPTPLAVVSRLLDKESSDFADDFASALDQAHWKSMRISNRISSKYGVSIGIVADERNAPEVKLLSDALTAIGVSHDIVSLTDGEGSMNPHVQSHVLYLLIEQHPPLTGEGSDATRNERR